MRVAALIVAAGRGTRAGAGLPKQYRPVGGLPLLRHTLSAFSAHPDIDLVLTVIHRDDGDLYEHASSQIAKTLPAIPGGDTRQASVLAGLEALVQHDVTHVLIHDGARPFVSAAVIDGVLHALAHGKDVHGALPALAVTDTLRRAAAGMAGDTLSREGLVRAQTPQGFEFNAILAAHRAAPHDQFTDDVAIAADAGLRVALVAGAEENFKVTEPQDFLRAEQFLAHQRESRTGSGFDVHRFCEGDHVTLCGVRVPHTQGLLGHSDADVGLHALTDALLGTIGEGDIGDHFPPSDPKWKGAASDIFLKHAGKLVEARGGRITNLDITLICEAPKIGPHRDTMRQKIADILHIEKSRVSVKATTTEALGFTGRREGIAAQAIATVSLLLSGGGS
ncbi:MAG: bifunctional 2-C-methyl-D-erythritol 4-phosphate cytidylyltransferase/2-C-methyl-D-erythritol 2,4-cyclodiphosphate synthase [Parvibaculum sp.]